MNISDSGDMNTASANLITLVALEADGGFSLSLVFLSASQNGDYYP